MAALRLCIAECPARLKSFRGGQEKCFARAKSFENIEEKCFSTRFSKEKWQ